jgi:hypothetical protein
MTRDLHNKVLEVTKRFRRFFVNAGVTGRDLALPEPIPKWYRW